MTSQVVGKGRRETKAAVADEVAALVYSLVHAWDQRMEVAVAGLRRTLGIGLTLRQALAIWHLHQPIAMGHLALLMACDQSNVTGIVDRLERGGFMRREVDSDDRRVKRLVLTEAGLHVRTQLESLLGTGPALATLTLGDLQALRDLLQRTLAVSERSLSSALGEGS